MTMKEAGMSMNGTSVSLKTVACRGSKMSVSRKAPRPTRALPRGLSVPKAEAAPLPYSARTPPVQVNIIHYVSLFIICQLLSIIHCLPFLINYCLLSPIHYRNIGIHYSSFVVYTLVSTRRQKLLLSRTLHARPLLGFWVWDLLFIICHLSFIIYHSLFTYV